MMWSFDRNRLMLGDELLSIQGQDRAPPGYTQPQLSDLAGNSMLAFKLAWLGIYSVSSVWYDSYNDDESY